MTELRAEILKLILKLYKFVTYYDLPEPLRSKDAVISWGIPWFSDKYDSSIVCFRNKYPGTRETVFADFQML